ncbi:MAG: HAMP domain-containing sensor histidine kinase [Pseudomonadota bacterium]
MPGEPSPRIVMPATSTSAPSPTRAWVSSLSAKLLLLTILFVMLAEVLIFFPSVANYRVNWLQDRLRAAQLAALAAEGRSQGVIPQMLRKELLQTARVRSVALKRDQNRQLVLRASMPGPVTAKFDFREWERSTGPFDWLFMRFKSMWDAMGCFTADPMSGIMVLGEPAGGPGQFIEVVVEQGPLCEAMAGFALKILLLSILISVITAALVYFALNRLLVRPITRISSNMLAFSEDPEQPGRIITPSARDDEIGVAERELANMQTELRQLLQEKSRLAAVGLAVSKINHDLRNMLSSAQLISDRFGTLPDPTVQRFAPKLIASLDRAISFCNDTLRFGRVKEAPPARNLFALNDLAHEVADGLGLASEDASVRFIVSASDDLLIDGDRDQLFRVVSNLCRNAKQALEQTPDAAIEVQGWRDGAATVMMISDNGPGIPQRAKAHLFQPFQGSMRKGGSGLGLAIAHELVAAHGGSITLRDTEVGASFVITLPDRDRAGV